MLGNRAEETHRLRGELAARAPYAAHLAGAAVPSAHSAAVYLDVLTGLGCTVLGWETTYLHVLTGTDSVFTRVSARQLHAHLRQGERGA